MSRVAPSNHGPQAEEVTTSVAAASTVRTARDALEATMDVQRESLTPREIEILGMVATGVTNREIAFRLGISANTVKVHLRNVFSKLNAESRTEAPGIALREGLVRLGGSAAGAAPQNGEPGERLQAKPVTPPLPAWRRATVAAAALLVVASLAATWPSSGSENGEEARLPLGQQGDPFQSGPVGQQESSWSERAHMRSRLAYLAAVAVEGEVLAIGGLSPEGTSGSVERYDPENDLWTRGSDKPTPVRYISGAAIGGEAYVPGGCDVNLEPVRVVEVYSPASDTWREVSPLPEPRCAYALAVVAQRLYLFGGWDGEQYVADTYVFDANADEWSQSVPMDAARGYVSAATLGGRIYVVGGYDGRQELTTCAIFHPESHTWDACAPLAIGRGGLGLAALGGQLYAIGTAGQTTYLGFNERYNPATDTWSPFETPLVGEWGGVGVAVLELTIYAVGGWDSGHLSVNQAYDPLPFRTYIPVSQQQ